MTDYTIILSARDYEILHDLISVGLEAKLAPFDHVELSRREEFELTEILAAVALYSSHLRSGS